jgi:hypothetical protein
MSPGMVQFDRRTAKSALVSDQSKPDISIAGVGAWGRSRCEHLTEDCSQAEVWLERPANLPGFGRAIDFRGPINDPSALFAGLKRRNRSELSIACATKPRIIQKLNSCLDANTIQKTENLIADESSKQRGIG